MVLIWPLLAPLPWIVASNLDVVLEGILVAIDHGGHVCKNSLDLRLSILVQAGRTEKLQGSCTVPVNVGFDPRCVGNDPRVIVGSIDLIFGTREIFAAGVVVQEGSDLVLGSHAITGSGWDIGARGDDVIW